MRNPNTTLTLNRSSCIVIYNYIVLTFRLLIYRESADKVLLTLKILIRIGSTVSSTSALTHGVPQGSILSPFLFGIYVNDLPAVTVSSDLDSYVDDSKLHLAFLVEDVQQTIAKLENDLYKTAKWCLEHQLLFNPDKTKFFLVGTRSMLQNLPTQINLKFLGKTLKLVSVAKDLGMHLDIHLSYDDHISN